MRGSSKLSMPRVLPILGVALLAPCWGYSQSAPPAEGMPLRQFRDRDGHELEARLVSLSSDLREVRIERSDGRTFDLPVTRISLDDQQYLREWLLAPRPLDPESTRLEFALNRVETTGEKQRIQNQISEAQWESSHVGYEISLTSLTREPIANLRLEYCLLVEDAVEVLVPTTGNREATEAPDAEGGEEEVTRLWRAPRDAEIRYRFATLELPPLIFNRSRSIDTGTISLDAISSRGGVREDHKDRCIGILVRLVARDGTVLAEKHDLIRDHSSLDWAAFTNRRDPREAEGSGTLTEVMVSNSN